MVALKIALAVPAIFGVVQTALSLVRSRAWWVRTFDFPRLQIAILNLLLLGALAATNLGRQTPARWEWVVMVVSGLAAAVQLSQILPYTRLWRVQVRDASREDVPRDRRLRIVISNVCQRNREVRRWLDVVQAEQPDLIIAVEVDAAWCRELTPLADEYPHRVLQPQDNSYGMAVYSRHPLSDTRIEHLVEKDVPSIFTTLELPGGDAVQCVALHPRPPRPDIGQDSDLRDAELVKAGGRLRKCDLPCIIAGDLNDVAWSHTTHLFQRLARVLDPRIGRGRYSTFHADHRFLRWPLDHVFHSRHFDLVELRRLEHVGSDHFPILVELALREEPLADEPVDELTASDVADAQEAVEDATERKHRETPAERRQRKQADR